MTPKLNPALEELHELYWDYHLRKGALETEPILNKKRQQISDKLDKFDKYMEDYDK